MSSTYEFYLTDDAGRRITLLQGQAFFSYSRLVEGFGSFQIGFPYDVIAKQVFPVFQPDRRIEVWRSPGLGIPLRHESTFLLRRANIYTRETDAVTMIVFYSRDLKDLLRRRYIIQPAGYSQTSKTDFIDDMMKEIVSEQMLFGSALDADAVVDNTRAYPQDEFSVQGEFSLGPEYHTTIADRNVLDVLKSLHEASRELYELNPLLNKRIYFDISPALTELRATYILDEETSDAILGERGEGILEETSPYRNETIYGMQFVTYAGLRGTDRTQEALVFSVENGNITAPNYSVNHFEEENAAIVKGFGRGDSRAWDEVVVDEKVNLSRWNRCEVVVDASTEPDQDQLANYAYPVLYKNGFKEEIDVTFLNIPENPTSPRSLYGVDWDLGDLLPVFYAGKQFNLEVNMVYVSVDDQGKETITGRNMITGSDQ